MPISFDEVPSDAAASGVFVESKNVKRAIGAGFLPHKILLIGQAKTGHTPTPTFDTVQLLESEAQAKTRYGRGSMLALMARSVFKTNGSIPVYAVCVADDVGGVVAAGSITVAGPATSDGVLRVYIGNTVVRVAVTSGQTAATINTNLIAAINANLDLPLTALVDGGIPEKANLTAKWKGVTGNDIYVAKSTEPDDILEEPTGVTLTVVAMASGATNPDIAAALDAMGQTWYTILAVGFQDTDTYDALRAKGIELEDPIERRMFLSFIGFRGAKSAFLTLLTAKNSKHVSYVPVPLSKSISFEIAASTAGLVARSAQIDPARPRKTLELTAIGGAAETWLYTDRDTVVKAGGSTTITDDSGVVRLEDEVTTYAEDPDLSENLAYRFGEVITNQQVKVYQMAQTFGAEPFSRSIIVDDNSTTSKQYAIRPKTVKAFAIQLVNAWTDQAWSKNREEIIAGITAEINGSNAGRIDLLIPDVFSAGGRIFAIRHEWAFEPPIVE